MERGTKIALGVGALLGAALLLSRSGGRSVNVIGQGYDSNGHRTPWANMILGFGNDTYASAACVLCALCQAFNTFNPDTPITPDVAGERLKRPGPFPAGAFFSGSSAMSAESGANMLGMDKPASEAVSYDGQGMPTPGHIMQMRAMLDKTLSRGGIPLIRVDHDRDIGLKGDHTMSVLSGGDGTYQCADPALARMITIDSNLQGRAGIGWGVHLPYQVVGVSSLFNV